MTGVPPGLQNQCGALGASRVGSIPTCPRQKRGFPAVNVVKKLAEGIYRYIEYIKAEGKETKGVVSFFT